MCKRCKYERYDGEESCRWCGSVFGLGTSDEDLISWGRGG